MVYCLSEFVEKIVSHKISTEEEESLDDVVSLTWLINTMCRNYGMPPSPTQELLEKIEAVETKKQEFIRSYKEYYQSRHIPNMLNPAIQEGFYGCTLKPAPGLGLVSEPYQTILQYHHKPQQREISVRSNLSHSTCFTYDYYWSGSDSFGALPYNDNEVEIIGGDVPFDILPMGFQLEEVYAGRAGMDTLGKCFKLRKH